MLTVDDDGGADYVRIQDAIDNATDGDTVRVFEGTYHESINVSVSIDLMGDGPSTTMIDGGGEGDVMIITADRVNLSGFNITGAGSGMNDAGIKATSGFNRISNVNCSEGRTGISLEEGDNTTISNSSFRDNFLGVIILTSNNTVSGNNCSGSIYGISISGTVGSEMTKQNTISNNHLISNSYGISCMRSGNSRISNNTILFNGFSGVYSLYCSWITIEDNLISGSMNGMFQVGGDNITLLRNKITGNTVGITLIGSVENISANRNFIHDNTNYGINAESCSSGAFRATNNWWGSEFGPTNPEANWNGRGDNITGGVEFDPWIGKEHAVKYVDDDAVEGGDGSMDRPLNNIQDAIDDVLEGGFVHVWDGLYPGSVMVNKTVYLYGNDSATTIIDGEGSGSAVSITADRVNLSGFGCINSGDDPGLAGISIFSDGNTIYNNSCTGNGGNGIGLYGSEHNSIFDNNLSSNDGSGALFQGSDHNEFRHNRLVSNGDSGLLLISSSYNDVTAVHCKWNTDGIRLTSHSHDNIIERSNSSVNGRHGIFLEDSRNASVLDNQITGNGNGITLAGATENAVIRFNSLHVNAGYALNDSMTGDHTVVARDNWWGETSGPYHEVGNPEGKGGHISNGIVFDPWLSNGGSHMVYAGVDEPGGGDGSREHPYNDVQDALDKAKDGEIVRVLEGYYWFGIFDNGYRVERRIHVIGSGIQNTILDSNNRLDHQDMFHVSADGCSITGFTFRYCSPHHELAGIGLSSSYNRIYGNHFEYNNNGIYLYSASHNVISNNTFYGNYREIDSTHWGNSNNLVLNNEFTDKYMHGVSIRGSFNTFQGNQFNYRSSLALYGDNNTVRDNTFNGSSGTYVEGVDHFIHNNTFVNCYVGINIRNNTNTDISSRITITRNSFTKNGKGITITGNTTYIVIQHNIFRENDQGIVIQKSIAGSRIHYNQIFNNTRWGINVTHSELTTVDARFNWWGHTSGPYHSANNSGGKGGNVSDNVRFDPWSRVKDQPAATIDSIFPKPVLDTDTIRFKGHGTTAWDEVVRYAWRSSLDGGLYNGTDQEFAMSSLSAGNHTIFLKVESTAGIWSFEANTTLIVHERPVAMIDSISPDPAFETNRVRFQGNGTDDGSISGYAWRSSLDGEFYNGTESGIDCRGLSNGSHVIHFKVMDDFGVWSDEVSANLTVRGKPETVSCQVSPDIALVNDNLRFRGIGIDDGSIVRYAWRSSLDGELYNDTCDNFSCTGLSPGEHVIYFRVQDDDGMWSDELYTTVMVHEMPAASFHTVSPNPARHMDRIRFRGNGSDDGHIIRYAWRSSLDGEFHNDTDDRFYHDALSVGIHTISFRVQDNSGVWSEEVSMILEVRGELQARILSVVPNPALISETILFEGGMEDDGPISRYVWSSSLDGEFHNGTAASFGYGDLSRGVHTISLRIQDDHGFWSDEVSVELVVTERPVAMIESVSPDIAVETLEVLFHGIGSDDGTIARYAWRSSLDGEFCNGTTARCVHDDLSAGAHTIYLKVRDNDGFWSHEVSIDLVVKERPTSVIDSITPTVALDGEPVLFRGHGSSWNTITGYSWRSDLDGVIGTSDEFRSDALSPGIHIIFFMVMDGNGAWSEEDSADLLVHRRPTARIETISPEFPDETDTIRFVGKGSDDDGIVCYAWRSNLDGELYNGTSAGIEYGNLSSGSHIIFFRVMDERGVWSRETASRLDVNGIPRACMGPITPNPSFKGDSIRLTASVEDDGEVREYEWRSSIDGLLYRGEDSTIEFSGLSVGTHTIRLRAMDDSGVWSEEVSTKVVVTRKTSRNEIPVVILEYPHNTSVVSGRVTLVGSAVDNDGTVERVEISIDGGEWTNVSGTAVWNYVWDSTRVDNGEHELRFRAFDGEDHSGVQVWSVVTGNSDEDEKETSQDPLGYVVIAAVVGLFAVLVIMVRSLPDTRNKKDWK